MEYNPIIPTSLSRDPDDYVQERMFFPVLGIVLEVNYANNYLNNRTAVNNFKGRGTRAEATVLMVNDGADNSSILTNVVILPMGKSDFQDYQEELPTPAFRMINEGEEFSESLRGVDISKLDGSFCIVQFVGGSITQPIMTHWFPHLSNTFDPATDGSNGIADNPLLDQKNRFLKRFAGTTLCISANGDIYLDTTKAASERRVVDQKVELYEYEDGGDVKLNIKEGRELEINFNPPINDLSVPGLPLIPGTVEETVVTKAALQEAEERQNALEIQKEAQRSLQEAKDLAKKLQYQGAQAVYDLLIPPYNEAQNAYNQVKSAYDSAKELANQLLSQFNDAQETIDNIINGGLMPPASVLVITAKEALDLAKTKVTEQLQEIGNIRNTLKTAAESLKLKEIEKNKALEIINERQIALNNASIPVTPQNRDLTRIDSDGNLVRGKSRATFTDSNIELVSGNLTRIMSRGDEDSVEIGGNPENGPIHHAALAEPIKESFNNNAEILEEIITKLNFLLLSAGQAPIDSIPSNFPLDGISERVKIK